MKKRLASQGNGRVSPSVTLWFVVFWCCFASAALGGQKAEVRSCLQSAADLAAQAGVSSLDCSTGGWAGALQAVLDQLATQEVPNEPGMSTSLAVNPGLVQVLDDADTPANTWDKVLVWDYAASGRTGADADKNLIVRIRRGRYYPEAGEGRKVFESMEHDEATNTGWVTANPNIPAFVAANAVLVELERPRVRVNSEKSPARAVYQSVKATALAVAGPVDEVMVAPFAIPVCSLLDEYGEFQGDSMAVIDRIFTEAARYCEGEGPNCNNMPTFPYTPCSQTYKDKDIYLWESGKVDVFSQLGGYGTVQNMFSGTLVTPAPAPDPGCFCYHRIFMDSYNRSDGAYPLYHDSDPGDSRRFAMPLAGWFPGNANTLYDDYEYVMFGKTQLMASDHAAAVGLPARAVGYELNEAAVLAILGRGGAGTVPARIGESFQILDTGLTSQEDEVWNRITGAYGSGPSASNPPYGSTELGTIDKNYVEFTMRSYSTEELAGHAKTFSGLDVDRDGVTGPSPDLPSNDYHGHYLWDRGMCSSRRVKLQCATDGRDHLCAPTGVRADVPYGEPAPESGDLVQWWYENELAGYWADYDGDGVKDSGAGSSGEELSEWWQLSQCGWNVRCKNAKSYAEGIKLWWDIMGVLGRLFVVPADGVTDDTPVWKVKVPIIGVRGTGGGCCQDVDGAFDCDPGPRSDWDPVVDPDASWEIIGFVDMLIYDLSIRDMSDWLPPFEQKTHFGQSPLQGAIIGKDDGTGRTYGPGAFYFLRGTDAAGNPLYGKEDRAANLDKSASNQHIRSANLVRARITVATDFIPTSANEGSRTPQLVKGWGRR